MIFQSSPTVKEKVRVAEVHACAYGMGLWGEFYELKVQFLKFLLLFPEDLHELSSREMKWYQCLDMRHFISHLCPVAHHGKWNEYSCCAYLWKVSQTDKALMTKWSIHWRNNESCTQRGNRFSQMYWYHHANYSLLKENLQVRCLYWYGCTKLPDFCPQQPKELLRWFCFISRTGSSWEESFIFF